MNRPEVIEAIRALLTKRGAFVVIGHTNPDGDAIGACYALAMALAAAGKRARVLLDPYASKYDIIPGVELRSPLPSHFAGATGATGADEVCVAVDCGDPARMGAARAVFDRADITVCIDHHMTNPGFASLNYIEPAASSSCEMVYNLIEPLFPIDGRIAAALYAGLVSDTDGFRFSSVSAGTHTIAGRLIGQGIPFTDIYTELLHRRSFTEAKLLGQVMEVCERKLNKRVVLAAVTREMLRRHKASARHLEGAVEYLLNLRGVEVSVLVYERDAVEAKVSLRSRSLNVAAVANALGGGGHRYAAGATVEGDADTVSQRVLKMVEQGLNADG